eukprot:8145877-Pyramimonas_sp.AAC.1
MGWSLGTLARVRLTLHMGLTLQGGSGHLDLRARGHILEGGVVLREVVVVPGLDDATQDLGQQARIQLDALGGEHALGHGVEHGHRAHQEGHVHHLLPGCGRQNKKKHIFIFGAFGPISGEAFQNSGQDDGTTGHKTTADFRPVRDSFGT